MRSVTTKFTTRPATGLPTLSSTFAMSGLGSSVRMGATWLLPPRMVSDTGPVYGARGALGIVSHADSMQINPQASDGNVRS